MHAHWSRIDSIPISSRLSISDSSLFYDEPLVLSVPAGIYDVYVRVVRDGSDVHVAGARATKPGGGAAFGRLARGSQAGVVCVDFAQIGICDRDAVEQAFSKIPESEMSVYYDQLRIEDLTGLVMLPDHTKMVITSTGYGDGTYPVYVLLDLGNDVAGVEVDFLAGITD